jgi:arylsulfatase A-like enzyme
MSRPNILVVMQDQLRYDLVHDHPLCRTPNLDRLRAEGVDFTQAYTPAGICGPARASILTGLYPHTHGVLNNVSGTDAISRNLRHDFPTMAELLGKAGYRTGYVGKWHVGVEDQAGERGFADVRLSDPEMWAEYKTWAWQFSTENPAARHTRYPAPHPRLAERFPRRPFPLYSPGAFDETLIPAYGVADETVRMLHDYTAGDEPFLLFSSFLEPHWPHVLPEPYASMYDPATIEPWPNFADSFDAKPRTSQAMLHHFGVGSFTWEDWAPIVAHYLGAVTFLDDLVGRILTALDASPARDNTIVLATADHGDLAGAHRMFNKGPVMYDEVYRLPFVWRGPGFARGAAVDEFVSHVDVLPTLLGLADVALPEPVHGTSLLPLLRGDDGVEWRDAVLSEFHGDEFGLCSQRMVRWENYKLIYNPNDITELYDLTEDPWELHNLAEEASYASLRRDLEARLLELMHETDDSLRLWAVNTLA